MSSFRETLIPDPPCVLLGQYYRTHAKRSGYIRLADGMPEAEVVRMDQTPPKHLTLRGLTWLARRASSTRYLSLAGLGLERAAIARMLRRPQRTVFHFLYGHPGFAWAARWARRTGHLCVATFHVTPSLANEIIARPDHLDLLDGIILVGSSQRAYFQQHVRDPKKLFHVPHGVDTDFFTPGIRTPSASITCLAVGSYLRNFALLARVVDALADDAHVRFVVVASPEVAPQLAGRPNVTFVSGLTDAQLRAVYRRSDLFVLCARDVTANNALLEAMACGLPVVAEEVGSMRDYVGADNAVLCPRNDPEAMVAAIRERGCDSVARTHMGDRSRQRALDLSWSRVADRIRLVYRAVAEQTSEPRRRPSRAVTLLRRAAMGAGAQPGTCRTSASI